MAIPKDLLDLEKKWEKKTKGKGKRWADAVRGKEDVWAEALSVKTGVPVSDIKAGPMYKEFKEFAANPDEYIDDFESGVEAAAKVNKWARRFYEALTGKSP